MNLQIMLRLAGCSTQRNVTEVRRECIGNLHASWILRILHSNRHPYLPLYVFSIGKYVLKTTWYVAYCSRSQQIYLHVDSFPISIPSDLFYWSDATTAHPFKKAGNSQEHRPRYFLRGTALSIATPGSSATGNPGCSDFRLLSQPPVVSKSVLRLSIEPLAEHRIIFFFVSIGPS